MTRRYMKTGQFLVFMLTIATSLALAAEEPSEEETAKYDFAVKRVSSTILTLWMHDTETPNRLPFILFLEGEENWYKGEVKTAQDKHESALILEYSAGKGTVTLEYNPEENRLLLFGIPYDLSLANVFAVRGFTGYSKIPTIRGIVAWDIVCPEKMNPAEYVLSRMRKEGLAQ